MIEPETHEFLESGCSIACASVAADGQPHATRGWGMTVLSPDPVRVRLLLAREDATARENLAPSRAVAVTAVNVATLRSTQFKGRVVEFEDSTPADGDRAREFCDAFFGVVHAVEGTAFETLAHLPPADYAACVIEVDEWFDQTPGPAAGARIAC